MRKFIQSRSLSGDAVSPRCPRWLASEVAELLDKSQRRPEHRDGTDAACRAAVTADVKRQIARMVGEFLREAGVLVIVLAPLEWLVTHGTLTLNAIVAIVVVAMPCLIVGMVLGLER
jgi:hypothetical protein